VSYRVLFCPILSYHVLSCHILSYSVPPCPIYPMSGPIISYHLVLILCQIRMMSLMRAEFSWMEYLLGVRNKKRGHLLLKLAIHLSFHCSRRIEYITNFYREAVAYIGGGAVVLLPPLGQNKKETNLKSNTKTFAKTRPRHIRCL